MKNDEKRERWNVRLKQDAVTDETSEHEAARIWRESKGWSRRQLADKLGFSESMIQDFEAGSTRGTGKPIGAAEWKRYRNACAGLDAETEFKWGRP